MYIFIAIVILVIILNIFLIRSSKIKKPFEAFLEEERLANTARKNDVPKEFFITPDKNALPFREYTPEETRSMPIARAQASVMSKIDKPMLRLPEGMGNNEVKLAYGVANFEFVTAREDNYNALIRALVNWAGELAKREMYDEAKAVLSESIRLKSDLSLSYTSLFDICALTDDKQKLKELTDTVNSADFMPHNKTVREKIQNHINQ